MSLPLQITWLILVLELIIATFLLLPLPLRFQSLILKKCIGNRGRLWSVSGMKLALRGMALVIILLFIGISFKSVILSYHYD